MAACGEKPQPRTPSDTPPPSPDLPRLEEVDLEIPEGDRPIAATNTLALTARGTITYRPGLRRDTILTTIDSTGTVIARWGRRGEGPGELIGDELLLSGDSLIAAVGVDGERVRVFDPLGRLVAERSDVPSGLPSDLLDGRIYWWRSFRVGEGPRRPASRGRLEPFEAWCTLSPCREILLSTSDSVLMAIHQAATPMLHGAWPAFGAYGDRFVVANGYDYTLWLYQAESGKEPLQFGRDLPPRLATAAHIARAESSWAKLERTGMPGPGGQRIHENFDAERTFLREAPLPHFQYGGIKFDGRGRMRVMRQDRRFHFLRHLRRYHLPGADRSRLQEDGTHRFGAWTLAGDRLRDRG